MNNDFFKNDLFKATSLKKLADDYNIKIESQEERFRNLKNEDKEVFKNFIFNAIHDLANIGCLSWEYETDTNLKETFNELFECLKNFGFKYQFYELNKDFSDHKFCLMIDWNV